MRVTQFLEMLKNQLKHVKILLNIHPEIMGMPPQMEILSTRSRIAHRTLYASQSYRIKTS
jgi:hypothetical protein